MRVSKKQITSSPTVSSRLAGVDCHQLLLPAKELVMPFVIAAVKNWKVLGALEPWSLGALEPWSL